MNFLYAHVQIWLKKTQYSSDWWIVVSCAVYQRKILRKILCYVHQINNRAPLHPQKGKNISAFRVLTEEDCLLINAQTLFPCHHSTSSIPTFTLVLGFFFNLHLYISFIHSVLSWQMKNVPHCPNRAQQQTSGFKCI